MPAGPVLALGVGQTLLAIALGAVVLVLVLVVCAVLLRLLTYVLPDGTGSEPATGAAVPAAPVAPDPEAPPPPH